MKIIKNLLSGFAVILTCTTLSAQIYHVEPPNWWAGMKSQNLQLLVHGKDVGETTPILTFPGIVIQKVNQADSKNYLFLDLYVSAASPCRHLPKASAASSCRASASQPETSGRLPGQRALPANVRKASLHQAWLT